MNVNCSTCLELLSSSDDVSCTPCGHAFHTPCILQWFETGKSNCPQCRARCRENQLRRLYFTEGIGASQASSEDPNKLQSQVDSLSFQLRCAETDKKNLKKELESEIARHVGLQEKLKKSEKARDALRNEVETSRIQVKYFQDEQARAKRAVEEVAELKKKLQLCRSVDEVLSGSLVDAQRQLHQLGGNDFSETAHQLSIMVQMLKKQIIAQKEEKQATLREARQRETKLGELKQKVTSQATELSEMTQVNKALTSDLRQLEDECSSLRSKVKWLQDSLNSPSGDARASAINRIITESPAPKLASSSAAAPLDFDMLDEEDDGEIENTQQLLKTKSCSLVGLNKEKNKRSQSRVLNSVPQMNIMKRPKLLGTASVSQPVEKSNVPDYFYNGMGGHSKDDAFPRPVFAVNKPVKNKKVTRPKASARANHIGTIDKFFVLDMS